jgi:hypothetical protein
MHAKQGTAKLLNGRLKSVSAPGAEDRAEKIAVRRMLRKHQAND